MKGWSIDLWDPLPFTKSKDLTYEDLEEMLGNMWSMRHYVPFLSALLGSLQWPENDMDLLGGPTPAFEVKSSGSEEESEA